MRQCLFCPSTELTREHLWPDWIVKMFKRNLPRRQNLFTATQTRQRVVYKQWQQPTITHKVRIVCDPCNSKWMSQLETCASPILTPLIQTYFHHQFTELELRTLAAWVTLRSMVFESLTPSGQPTYYTYSERAAFADSRTMEPPPHTYIWFAPFVGRPYRAMFTLSNQLAVPNTDGLQVLSIVLNQVAIKFATWKGRKRTLPTSQLNADEWDNVTRRIWPLPRRPVNWPPSEPITDGSLKSFADVFVPQLNRV